MFLATSIAMQQEVKIEKGAQNILIQKISNLVETGKQVIISADKSPTDLDGIEERLKSRLVGGICAGHSEIWETAECESLSSKIPLFVSHI